MTQIVDLSVQKTFFLVRNQVETGLLVKKQVCFPDADFENKFLIQEVFKVRGQWFGTIKKGFLDLASSLSFLSHILITSFENWNYLTNS